MPELEMDELKKPETQAVGSLVELLDRVLDKGLVVIGDIRISVADIELLKIQIRLLIASVDKAKEMGIDFSWAGIPMDAPSKRLEDVEETLEKIKKKGQQQSRDEVQEN